MHRVRLMEQCIIPLIVLTRYTIQATLCNLAPSILKLPANAGFSVLCEAIPRQVNYLIDKASCVGKGANSTISMVHHYFSHHGLGETRVHLHADNCSGQNKNNFFLWYLAW